MKAIVFLPLLLLYPAASSIIQVPPVINNHTESVLKNQ